MHDSHIDNLLTIRANLRGAIWNRREVSIDGGTFGTDELRSLLLAVEGTLIRERDGGSEHTRQRLSAVHPKLGSTVP